MNQTPITPDPADEVVARLSAADPAGDATVDTESIRMSVGERLSSGDELAARRESRSGGHRGWWIGAAAAVCALALAAGTGFVVGRSGGTAETTTATPAFRLNAPSGQTADSAGGAASSPALGAPVTSGAATLDSKMMPWFGGRTIFTAGDGLSTTGGKGGAFVYDARAIDGKSAAQQLADAFGIKGSPVDSGGAWVVGPTDGSGPSVSVTPDGMRSFYSFDPSVQPYPCAKSEVGTPVPAESGNSSGGSSDAYPGPACPSPTGATKPAPQGDDAIAVARKTMKAAGVDPDGFQWRVEPLGDPNFAYVTASQTVNGQLTGSMWGFSIVGGGKLAGVNGFLAPLVPLGDYDTVSATDAVARLGNPMFGGSYGGPMPMAADTRGGVAVASGTSGSAAVSGNVVVPGDAVASSAPTEPPAAMKPGAKFSWPVAHVTITKATLGLAQYFQPDGSVVLMPTYQLDSGDQGVYSMTAVVDSALDMTAP
ncbi:MAG: hypothetical protein WCP26_07115 [Actinomycetes bacterium]